MRRVVVTEHLTLDGGMQAPGCPDEDTRGGFAHGGWAMPNNDEVMARVLGGGMAQGGPLLFGRRTYEGFYGYWPHQPTTRSPRCSTTPEARRLDHVDRAAAMEQLHPAQG
jgi:dihydrofolate reductase